MWLAPQANSENPNVLTTVCKGKKKDWLSLIRPLQKHVPFQLFRTLMERIPRSYFLTKSNSMEQMHSFGAKESIVLTLITAFLYFCAILAFAYLFTMS
jgi:hypothetical protein